eukprot:CAMPEP_0114475544 /NCGR_PEP_ID=MMETSP0104-20121206/14210_1 /TAXON_ID=37642 ORGANISM="Paraphysomonas imperforata, Strain PA2" /NCGR_SAMPLE_ID=MMETSP0104 /ASSEMBLY_ACC=CAM_ASM_000202 /LENGTH=50 /DNA_ID=CAMNT_0001650079 /DNA_START=568 /DNA_END=720 /DNA_ORIENTATION=+
MGKNDGVVEATAGQKQNVLALQMVTDAMAILVASSNALAPLKITTLLEEK